MGLSAKIACNRTEGKFFRCLFSHYFSVEAELVFERLEAKMENLGRFNLIDLNDISKYLEMAEPFKLPAFEKTSVFENRHEMSYEKDWDSFVSTFFPALKRRRNRKKRCLF